MDAAGVRAESKRLRDELQRLRDDTVARTNALLDRIRERGVPHHDGELSLRLPRLRASVGAARAALE